ncbi:MAG: hypothetical protein QOJ73_5621 [Streptosporangiaceae bacterium]|jgi:hypothetical protein|nr:hypothetical protein [Streptosporangiaceae bacterium]
MSFTDRLIVWFHIGFVIFAIGPVTIATMSTPRYIRTRNLVVLRYLSRMTRIFGAASLGVLLFGIIGGQSLHEMTKSWVTASMTLFVVALVMLLLIMRDQHRAIVALEGVEVPVVSGSDGQPAAPDPTGAKDDEPGPPEPPSPPPTAAIALATVERGRIASLAGVVSLIWLVILVLMVWNSH